MSKPRGVYKRYKFDPNFTIPRSTKYYKKKRNELNCETEEIRRQNTSVIKDVKKNENFSSDDSLQFNFANNDIRESDRNDTSSECVDKILKVIEECSQSSDTEGIPDKIEIVCALLATFFSGKMTQHALTLVLQLINVMTNHHLPKSFDELSKQILKSNNDRIEYTKKWYCSSCKKHITIDSRFQRICSFCKERFVVSINVPFS